MLKRLHGFFETKVLRGSHPDEERNADDQEPLSKEAKNFLLFVAQHPNRMSSDVSRDLGISVTGKRIREHLQAEGLITVTQGRSTTGRPAMFLCPTEQGLKILGLSSIISPPTVVTAMKEPDPSCRHYWIIEPAAGPLSRGECKNCHGEREFKNYLEALNNPIASPGI